jgi:capsular exopolysaccharide synthesis family protein
MKVEAITASGADRRSLRVQEKLHIAPEVVLAYTSSLQTHPANERFSLAAEKYRLLCTRVLHMRRSGNQVFLVTSAIPEEGKTLTSVNLAFGLNHAGAKKVLLVEFDLRRPSIHRLLGLRPPEVHVPFLSPLGDWRDSLRNLRPNLDALLAMQPSPQAHDLLNSDMTQKLIAEARKEYDFVLIDSAPLLVAGDTHVLLPWIDQALFVVRADRTPIECAKEAVEVLGKKLLGCVLNDVKQVKHEEYYYGYYGTRGKGDQVL